MSSRQAESTIMTRNQARFADFMTDVLVYIVVLNLFVEYVDAIVIDSFTISILTATAYFHPSRRIGDDHTQRATGIIVWIKSDMTTIRTTTYSIKANVCRMVTVLNADIGVSRTIQMQQ